MQFPLLIDVPLYLDRHLLHLLVLCDTDISLVVLLINFYAVFVIVVVVVCVLKPVVVLQILLPSGSIAATIATIPKVTLWFISQRLFSIIVYLNCFTTTANTIGEFVDIFND